MRCYKCIYKTENNKCKLSRCAYIGDYKEKDHKKHKCYNCTWARWTGTKYVCGLPRCMPKLGVLNGVDKNGQTKKNS